MNPRYVPQLQTVLTWPHSIGIVGGRPSSSLYFVGFQGDNVLFLDPHETQQVCSHYAIVVVVDLVLDFVLTGVSAHVDALQDHSCVLQVVPDAEVGDASSYHCDRLRLMPLASIDPSLAIGFYCRSAGELAEAQRRHRPADV